MRSLYKILLIECLLLVSCMEMNLPPEGEYLFSRISAIEISNIGCDSAAGGGIITDEGLGFVNTRGICWDTIHDPTISGNITNDGAGGGSFNSIMSGLYPATVYYTRAYAINDVGVSYSLEKVFKTNYGTVSDIDGNKYNTIKIGDQVWMKENLRTTHYSNGDPVENIKDNATWAASNFGASCSYLNDAGKEAKYGFLYNWFAATDNRGICPSGWHVPGDDEWAVLSDYLGGDEISGKLLKQVGINSEESCFAGLLTSFRMTDGTFSSIEGYSTYWWTSTNITSRSVDRPSSVFSLSNYDLNLLTDYRKLGLSIRCIKGDITKLNTNPVTNITDRTATGGGMVVDNENKIIINRGICWNTDKNVYPTISDNLTNEGPGDGNFESEITNLTEGTTYYIRAYITTASGIIYGNVISFRTSGKPVIQTTAISSVTSISATISGLIVSNGGLPVNAAGICWSLNENPTIDETFAATETITGTFSVEISGLMPDSTYYVKAFATNNLGTSYGNQVSFITRSKLPSVTAGIKSKNAYSATIAYNISDNEGDAVTLHGVCWSTNPDPLLTGSHTEQGLSSGSFESTLNGLTGGTLYYVRAYAVNSFGTAYSNEIKLLTEAGLPVIDSKIFISVNSNSVQVQYNIPSDGGSDIYRRGVCWGTSPGLTLSGQHTDEGSDAGTFIRLISSLNPGTRYYVRAYAENLKGIVFSDEITFLTLTGDNITDIEGNSYGIIQIGDQIWMQENLKTTKFPNGEPIPNVTDTSAWSERVTAGFCWFNNDIGNKDLYGALYNFYSVADARKICPAGWHVPSETEWNLLENYLGGSAASNLSVNGKNMSRFNAISFGYRDSNGIFQNTVFSDFWSSTYTAYEKALRIALIWNNCYIHGPGVVTGLSVRCIKD